MAERDEVSDQWAVDTESAVAVEVAAALNIAHDWAKGQVRSPAACGSASRWSRRRFAPVI